MDCSIVRRIWSELMPRYITDYVLNASLSPGEDAVSQADMTYADLNRFMFRLSLSRANRDLQHLAVKVIGILALNGLNFFSMNVSNPDVAL